MNTQALRDAGFTAHATMRLQQRTIPPFLVELLQRFGKVERCGNADRCSFDKASRKRIAEHFGGSRAMAPIEKWLDTYAILGDDGSVLTVAYRNRKFNRQ